MTNNHHNENYRIYLRGNQFPLWDTFLSMVDNSLPFMFNPIKIRKRIMNTWMKIAAGLLGGIAIVASLGGFKMSGKKKEIPAVSTIDNEIPDDIFDGNNVPQSPQHKGEIVRQKSEQNIRNLQDGLTRASNVLGHISIICNSIVKMFYEDPCIRVTPTTFIV